MLAGLFHSIRPMRAAPPTHRITEKISTTLAWRDKRCFLGYWIELHPHHKAQAACNDHKHDHCLDIVVIVDIGHQGGILAPN